MRCLLVCLAVSLILVPAARADDTYTVDSCATASGAAATTQGWTFDSAGTQTTRCPNPGVVAGAPLVEAHFMEGWNLRFTPPPTTSIAAFRLWRTVHLESYWNYTLFRDPSLRAEDVVERCWTMAAIDRCSDRGDGHATGTPDIAQSGLDSQGIALHVDCNPDNCPGTTSNVTVKRLQVDLHDRIDPTLGSVSGDLVDTSKPVSGVRTVSFSASDQGGGVYSARVDIDGAVGASGTVDTNGGRCVKPFKDLVPCKTTASGSLSIDTSGLADGVHAVRLVVYDATESNAVAYGPVLITTANQAIKCVPGVAPELKARFASTKKRALTRRGGFSLTGVLAGAAPGTPVLLLVREVRTGARRAVGSSALTGAGGKFRLRVPAGRSRTLTVAYRPAANAQQLRCARTLRLRVPARATFSAKRRGWLWFRLSGHLIGGAIPHRGKLVELQGYERGKWRTFDSVRTSKTGRFKSAYRFQPSSAGRRFRLRVRVRADASYPYSTGYSRVVRVTVR
jgi:hypothetical protein